MPNIGLGLVAGAAGTLALDIATHLDMMVRGRAASNVPSKLAGEFMGSVGLSLGSGKAGENRKSALGALFGYKVGVGMGVGYAVMRPRMENLPMPVTATLVGLSAMALSDATAVAYGVTDPADWGVMGWVTDIIFHLGYGYVTVAVYEALVDD